MGERKSENGFVSIFSALIIMLLLALVIIGFTFTTNRSIKRTLDDQLNTQAFYAAESGVNDAIDYLAGGGTADKNNCDSGGGSAFSYDIDTTLGVGYSCVLIDVDPTQQVFSPVPVQGSDKPIVANVRTTAPINSIVFSWDSTQPSLSNPRTGGFAGGGSRPNLPSRTTWGNSIGIVRVDLVPVGAAGQLNRQNLVANGYTFFLYPTDTSSSGNVSPGQAQAGTTILTNCNNTGLRCRTTVNLAGPALSSYRMRIQSLYNPTQISFEPLDASGTALSMLDGQAVIDSTGRANDVFRRIQVRVPLSEIPGFTDAFAVNSAGSVCKVLQVSPSGGNNISTPPGVLANECDIN
jgi:hypothetical protein